jgi:dTMP kinase
MNKEKMSVKNEVVFSGKRGKFIAIYGINGIGKTTQVELLVEYLKKRGKNASRLKYPVYDLSPEGPFIYKYLRDPRFRKKNELSTHKLQKKYANNRKRYEKELKRRLSDGEWIVAEDYIGTGIAWGLTWGGGLEYLERINEKLWPVDFSILLHGDRFTTAIEKDHRNEMESERMIICKNFHDLLADRYGWTKVNANQKIKKVQADILRRIKRLV